MKRGSKDSELEMTFKKGNFNNNANATVNIPRAGKFSFERYERPDNTSQHVNLVFSERLDSRQNIDGLVKIEGYKGKVKLSTIGNTIKVMPNSKINGSQKIKVSKAIKSEFGNPLEKEVEVTVTFEEANPEIKLLGKGVLVPDANEVIVPFEAIGLDAIDVEVFKIYENNMLQFLENNAINDNGYNLNGVGHIVYQQKVLLSSLGENMDRKRLKRYAIELSKLTNLDKSALYQVRIGYRKAYTRYASKDEENNIGIKNDYGQYESIMKYKYYNYEKRKNPANDEYYNSDKFVNRNLLSTNIGLIAKLGKDKKLHISALDIMNAKPLSGVELNVYTEQKQIDQVAYTGKNGLIEIAIEQQPQYIVAKLNGNVSYINLNDYRANSLTDFEISGKNQKKGVDGYIYGERGVWRPGDTIHLTFVLDDKLKTLPNDHPVTIEVYDTKATKRFTSTTTKHIAHMYTFSIPTNSSDPTGKWRAIVEIGDHFFSKNLRIETVKPNRIKMTYPTLPEVVNMYNNQKIELEADWLHGANASGLNAKIEMRISPATTKFIEYSGYDFDDPARKINDMSTQIFDGNLDVNGHASFPLKSNKDLLAPGMLNISLKTKIFEKSGNYSEDNLSFKANPYSSYVGVKVPTTKWGSRKIDIDKNQPVEMIALDVKGNPLKNRKIKVGLYNAEWRWWYNRRDNNLYSYNTAHHFGAIDTVTLRTDSNGKASWKTDIAQYGSHMIRACDDVSGHCTGQFFYVGHSWHREQGSEEQGSSLKFATDKEFYELGDKIKVSIPSSEGAKILVSIENNSSVVEEYWVDAKENETSFDVLVTNTV